MSPGPPTANEIMHDLFMSLISDPAVQHTIE